MGKNIPGSVCAFGAAYMLKQISNLEKEMEETQSGRDIEAVHRMRVSSRRLRNGIDHFKDCFSGKKAKIWDDEIRKITRALSTARDLDIQIQFINQAYEESLETTYRPGYRRLMLRLKQSRVKAQEKVNKTLAKLGENEVLERMRADLEAPVEDEAEASFIDPALFGHAYQAIEAALEDFLSYQPFITSSENADKLHAMRIAGKHLRYTMEAFAPIYGLALNPYINVMKEIQDQLGAFHDHDVWVNWLPRFIQKEQTRIEDYFGNASPIERLLPGLNHLLEDRVEAREKAYQSFRNTWEILEGENAWETLREMIGKFVVNGHTDDNSVDAWDAGHESTDESEDGEHTEFEVELLPESEDDTQITSGEQTTDS